jgi:hypothetical protein
MVFCGCQVSAGDYEGIDSESKKIVNCEGTVKILGTATMQCRAVNLL